MRRLSLAALALVVSACAAALIAAPPAGADRMVASAPLRGVDFLSAYNGAVVWGGRNASGRGSSYFASSGAIAARLRIASPKGGSLGDIDLGPDRDGATMAVYERCRSRTSGGLLSKCDIYRYRLASGAAGRVPGASSRRYDEHSPSVWGGRVAFLRARLKRDGTGFMVAGPPLGPYVTSPLRRLGVDRQQFWPGPTDLRKHIFVYRTEGRLGVDRILAKRFASGRRDSICVVARSKTVRLDEPQLDGGYVYWSRRTRTAWAIHRQRLPTRAGCRGGGQEEVASQTFRPSLRGTFRAIPTSFTVDRGRLFYGVVVAPRAHRAPSPYTSEIWEVEPVSFR